MANQHGAQWISFFSTEHPEDRKKQRSDEINQIQCSTFVVLY